MALVVFLRGVNVGGHRTFRPSILAQELRAYDVVNIGAAGTFVVWKPGSSTKFRAELLRKLTFDADVAICDGRELIALINDSPFGTKPPSSNVVRFVSITTKTQGVRPPLPITFPPTGACLVRLIAYKGRFIFGEYRRDMKTIGYLGQIDKLFGAKVTTRNWNTIQAVARILEKRATAP
jgi:uncharacterized protein (DUF1697 family)